jgi:hypothetical protein
MQSNEQQTRPGECPQCKWINGHRSWCSQFTLMSEDGRTAFLERLRDFTNAGHLLIEVWADADEVAPLPARLRPPLSLDEWLMELSAHYAVALAEQITVPDDDEITEWERDGDPCNHCGMAANYDPANGWYYHVDPTVPGCFLMGSGPIEGTNDPMTSTYLSGNTRRGPARPANEQEAWLANAALERSYDAEPKGKTMAANEVAAPRIPVVIPDEEKTDWEVAEANLATTPYPVYDGSGCRWIDLGPNVYGLIDYDGEYRIGLYYAEADQATGYDDEGVCATFEWFSDAKAYAERLVAIHKGKS